MTVVDYSVNETPDGPIVAYWIHGVTRHGQLLDYIQEVADLPEVDHIDGINVPIDKGRWLVCLDEWKVADPDRMYTREEVARMRGR